MFVHSNSPPPTQHHTSNTKMRFVLKLLLDISGSMKTPVEDTHESLYEALVRAAIVSIRELAEDLRPGQTLHVSIDTFSSEHNKDVSEFELQASAVDDTNTKLAQCETKLLAEVPRGGTAYFDAGVSSIRAVQEKVVGPQDKGYLIIVTDGQDNQSTKQTQFELKAAAAAAGKVRLIVLGSDDLSVQTRQALEEASQASQPVGSTMEPATFSRSSSASVQRAFHQVTQTMMMQDDVAQTPQPMHVDDNDDDDDDDFIVVDEGARRRPALRVVTNSDEVPFTSIFSPIRPHVQRGGVRRAATN